MNGKSKKIGLFGGSFNPIHNAHLYIANRFLNYFNLDKVLFIPAYNSPFKKREEYFTGDQHRLRMLEIALEDYPFFKIENYELMRKEVSFTIDTINYLKNKYESETQFFLLIGSDQAVDFHRWKDWNNILKSVKLCIAARNSYQNIFNTEVLNYMENNNINFEILDSVLIDISANEVRNKIKNNFDISELIPEKVMDYIVINNLYK